MIYELVSHQLNKRESLLTFIHRHHPFTCTVFLNKLRYLCLIVPRMVAVSYYIYYIDTTSLQEIIMSKNFYFFVSPSLGSDFLE
jgi:hypothetical protein